MNKKENRLFLLLSGFFVANVIVAEIIGGKIFSVEKTFGFTPFDWTLFGTQHLSLNMSAGSLPWPFVFVLTDVVNEYYGKRGVRFITNLAAGLILYAFAIIFLAMHVAPADFWLAYYPDIQPNVNVAFQKIFGQGLNIIFGSLVTFFVSQWFDAWIFHKLRHQLGEAAISKRALLSTFASQFVDSFLVAFIAFYLLGTWSFPQLIALVLVSYPYKFTMAVIMTPVLHWAHNFIDKYLGDEVSTRLRNNARLEIVE